MDETPGPQWLDNVDNNFKFKQCVACGFATEDDPIGSNIRTHFDSIHLYEGKQKSGQAYRGPKFLAVKERLSIIPDSVRSATMGKKEFNQQWRLENDFWYYPDVINKPKYRAKYHQDTHMAESETGIYCPECTRKVIMYPGVELGLLKVAANGEKMKIDDMKRVQIELAAEVVAQLKEKEEIEEWEAENGVYLEDSGDDDS